MHLILIQSNTPTNSIKREPTKVELCSFRPTKSKGCAGVLTPWWWISINSKCRESTLTGFDSITISSPGYPQSSSIYARTKAIRGNSLKKYSPSFNRDPPPLFRYPLKCKHNLLSWTKSSLCSPQNFQLCPPGYLHSLPQKHIVKYLFNAKHSLRLVLKYQPRSIGLFLQYRLCRFMMILG